MILQASRRASGEVPYDLFSRKSLVWKDRSDIKLGSRAGQAKPKNLFFLEGKLKINNQEDGLQLHSYLLF